VTTIVLHKKNERILKVEADPEILMEMQEAFAFFAKGYKFHPSFRNRYWDGRIRLLDLQTNEIPSGLFEEIKAFADESGYDVEIKHDSYYGYAGATQAMELYEFEEFVNGLDIRDETGGKIEPYDYQVNAAWSAVNKRGGLFLSPTASGKSLIIYIVMRWYLENRDDNALIIVPTTMLLNQMYNDFDAYSAHDDEWNAVDHVHRIVPGADKAVRGKRVTISCWQSLYKQPRNFFQNFKLIVGDEAHNCQAKSLTGMLGKCTETEFLIGTTGTLDGTKVHKMTLMGYFGSVVNVTKTKKLMAEGRVSQMKALVVMLKYSDEDRRGFPKKSWNEEISFIENNLRRNRFVRNLALAQDGTTLVLFEHIAHGKELFEMINDKSHSKQNVYYVDGSVKPDEKEAIRKAGDSEKGCIIVASYKTFSTGINIKNIRAVITASPIGKSVVRVLQSIGRGLRVSADGREFIWYDLVDDLHWKSKKNYCLIHAADRIKIYATEHFKYQIVEAKIT